MASLAAPAPLVAQDTGSALGLEQMGEAEIAAQIARCRDLASADAVVGGDGGLTLQGTGPEIELCNAYLSGQLDALLPSGLTSTAFVADLSARMQTDAPEAEAADGAAEATGDQQAQSSETATQEAPPEAQADPEAEEGAGAAQADAAENPPADAQDNQPAETAEAPAQNPEAEAQSQPEAGAGGDTTAPAATGQTGSAAAATEDVQSGTQPADEAETAESTNTPAEDVTAAEPAAEQPEAQDDGAAQTGADTPDKDVADTAGEAPEVAPMDSQEQADALAQAESETPAAAAAAETDAGASAEVDVVEETVTEDTARSSDEEFDTDVSENVAETQAAQQAPAAEPADSDDGLSNAQRAALLGLGALAVGSLLKSGEKVVTNSGDRAVVEQDGRYRILKNDDALLRQPGSDVTTYRFKDGSTRTVVVRGDGTEVETVRAADGRVLRRIRTLPDGTSTVLFDDTKKVEQVEVSQLPKPRARRAVDIRQVEAEDLAAALAAAQSDGVNRSFSLEQVRHVDAVRRLVPEITVDSINFETGSAVIRPQEAEELAALGNALRGMIDRNPAEVFLVEGHTDAVGAAAFNLALSDRRAESVALALTEYFDVPPENLVVQGYGESDLAIATLDAERANRRAAVRRITPLLQSARN
ncbi:hypothetical protein GCM10010973_04230 [Cribrihabitans marinus]|nr:hypothetical protein GCM10010973_04230 [Cribrihabitans marinus]